MALPAEITEAVDASPMVQQAYELAARRHAGLTQKVNGRPYIDHPLAVASVVAEAGADEEMVAAAMLHDVVEDSMTTTSELRQRFGDRVADLVEAMTDEAEVSEFERRKALNRERVAAAGPDAAVIYAADKLCGIRALREAYAEEGEAVESRYKASLDVKIGVWEDDVEMLDRLAPEAPCTRQLAAELEGLRSDRVKPLR
jgi:(p)ppGpp synthase/HD superfamily hydrolase